MSEPPKKETVLYSGGGGTETRRAADVDTTSVDTSESKKEADVKKRIALVLAVVTIAALVLPSVALADENEAGWWGNVVGFPYGKNPICLTAVDGGMIDNCQLQDPLRPYQPVKFDGIPPKAYIVTSGPAKAFVFAQPGQDNWIDWAWMVPGWWQHPMPAPPAPTWHMWQPGQMTHGGHPGTVVNVEQSVNVKGGGSVEQSVDVKSSGPTKVNVEQKVNMATSAKGPTGSKVVCFTYIVKKGDILSRIALKYHDTVSGLVARNKIANPSKIYVGQKLTVCDP